MARKRYISTDLSTDPRLSPLSEQSALIPLLYTWLIPHLDDWGRASGDSLALRLLVVPALPVSTEEVEAALQRMEEAGLIHRYALAGQRYLAVDPAPFYKAQPYIAKVKRTVDGSSFPPPSDPPWGKTASTKQPAEARQPAAACNAELNTNCDFVADFADLSASPSPSPSPTPTPSKIKVIDPQLEKRLGADAAPAIEKSALQLTDVRGDGPPSAPTLHGDDAVVKAAGCVAAREKVTIQEARKPPPPAVEAFRRIAGIYPVRSWWPEIEQAVGSNGGLARWEETVKAYVGLGWNRGNVANMLDFYRRGALPQTSPSHEDRRLRKETPHASPKAEAWLRLSEQSKKESVS